MFDNLKFGGVLLSLVCVAGGTMTDGASAVSVDVARKCNALTAKAFPPRVPGNPAAGRSNGSGTSISAYFQKCVTNGGSVQSERGDQNIGAGAKQ
jgi:hypothetical protein